MQLVLFIILQNIFKILFFFIMKFVFYKMEIFNKKIKIYIILNSVSNNIFFLLIILK